MCGDVEIKKGTMPIIIVNLLKVENNDYWKLYQEVIQKILASIGTQIFSLGKPEADYWDQVAIVKYKNRLKLCEMLGSKEFQEAVPNKRRGLSDTHTYCTVQII